MFSNPLGTAQLYTADNTEHNKLDCDVHALAALTNSKSAVILNVHQDN